VSGNHPYLKPARQWHAIAFAIVAIGGGAIWLSLQPRHAGAIGPSNPDAAWIPARPSNRWECIVIHHSASEFGGANRFDEWHKSRGWDGLGYHFVIGNGTDTPDGQVEVGFRWTQQEHGAHCRTPDDYYNQHGIGICLVGNFDNYQPSPAQLKSLVRLCRFLCRRFNIPPDQIFTHGGVTGKTDCPGKNFDLGALSSQVAQ
jgi:N-acetyl-anhydromuramyl-L-alanine amidase AmpD